ncbi:MAG: helix-turn-helix domain-containing protein [Parvibaculaceae bacterium]
MERDAPSWTNPLVLQDPAVKCSIEACVGLGRMLESDSYGEAFGRRLNARAASFVTRSLPRTMIAVTELKYDTPQEILSTPPIEEDAYLVAVHFKNFPRYAYWEDGRAAPVVPIRPGETIIYDIKRQPVFHLNSVFHSVHFYFPRAALDALADDANAPRIDQLHYKPAIAHADAVLRGMAESLLPSFRSPDRASRLFMDHLMLAAGHHVAVRYAGMRSKEHPYLGGLTPGQERRAKELLRENLAGDVPLAVVAGECGLSLSQFSRAFRKSVGGPPHRWVMRQRIALAKTLLREGSMPLSQVALECGFSDQSHFTRHFSASVGISPGAWRRHVRK